MKKTRLLAFLLLFAMLASLLSGCGGKEAATDPNVDPNEGTNAVEPGNTVPETPAVPDEEKYGGVFVFPIGRDPNTLLYAWLQSGVTNTLSSFINDKLFVLDEEGNIIPRLADKIDISSDGKVYTFHLRSGLTWHDGTPVTAEDMVWTATITQDPDWFASTVTGARRHGTWAVVDDSTFTITLDEANPLYINELQDSFFPQPKHYYDSLSSTAEFPTSQQAVNPIGCGPFKFVEYKVGDYIKLEANPDFWNGRPYLDTVYFKITGGGMYTQTAFEAGEVSTTSVSEDYYPEIKDDPRFTIISGLSESVANMQPSYTQLYTFDDDGNKKVIYTGDKIIREAMAYMIPYDEIIDKLLRGGCERSYSIMAKSGQYFTEDGLTKYYYDLDKANQILDDAGYVDSDGDGIRNWKDGSNITMLCSTFSPGSTMERMGVLFIEQLAQCGIAAGMKTEEQTSWAEHFLSGMDTIDIDSIDTTIYFWTYSMYGANAMDFAQNFSSTGEMSEYIDWRDPELKPRKTVEEEYEPAYLEAQKRVDEIFEQMKGADPATAEELFHEFQRIENNEMLKFYPIGTMYDRRAFQTNIHVEEAMWDLHSNYNVWMTEKIWVEK